MKKNMKRVIASFMVLAVSVCFIPTFAFAADNDVTWNTDYESFAYGGQTYGSDSIKDTVTKEATCKEDGAILHEAYVPDVATGSKVGETTEVVSKDTVEHTPAAAPVKENEVEATCETAGSYDNVTYCTVCEKELSRVKVDVPALGHDYQPAVENEVPATCKADGSHDELNKCTRCGKDEPGTRVTVVDPMDPDAHVWDEGKVTKEATCGEDGTKLFTCTVCKEATKEEAIPATGKHNYVEKIEVIEEATFDAPGTAERSMVCSVCGDVQEGSVEEVVIPQKTCEHVWDAGKVTKEPTDPNSCAATGEKTFTCTICGETKVEKFGAKEHQLKTVAYSFPATCTEDGYTYKITYCLNCDDVLEEETVINEKANGEHVWVADQVITPATCLEAGKADADYVYCDDCGVAYKKVNPDAVYYEIPAPGHHDIVDVEPAIENIVAATCTEKGKCDKVLYCKVCGKEASRTTVETAALGHDWDEGVVTKAPTCTEEGVKTFTCKNDATHTKTEPIEKLEHNFGPEVVTPATCVTPGQISKTCQDCHTRVDEEIPAFGLGKEDPDGHVHNINPVPVETVLTAPTCTKEGEKSVTYYCTEGDVISVTKVPIEKADHTWVDKEVKTEAVACAEGNEGIEGVQVQECSVCHATQEVPISQHDMQVNEALSYAATCEADGLEVTKCTRCGKEEQTVLPKLGHDYEVVDAEAHWNATDPKKGYIQYEFKCQNTGCESTKTEQVQFEWTKNPEDIMTAEAPFVYRFEEPATCTEAGAYEYMYVDKYGAVYYNPTPEVIDALGHNYEPAKRNVLDATCEKDGGYDLIPVCTACGEEKADQAQHVTVPALGHDWDEGEVTTEPTYDRDGVMTFTCKTCGKTREQAIPATAHTPGKAVTELALPENGGPTCTKPGKGYSVIYCDCKDENGNPLHAPVQLSKEEITVPATGHTASQPVYNEDLGYDVIECLDCGEVIDIVLDEDYDVDKFSPEDAAAVEKAKADLIDLYNQEKDKDNPDTAALKLAQQALYEAAVTAQDNIWKADLQIWFKDSANKTVKYNGKAVELAITDITITEKTTGEVTFKYYSDLECTQELAAAPKAVGTYYALATVAADKAYKSKTTATPAKIVISKAAIKVTPASKTYKIKKAKALPKNKTFKLTTKGLNKKIGATYKKANKVGGSKIKVSKAGKITVKKGLKKGTYKIKVKTTPKSKNFAAKTVTIKIVIKK